MLARHSALSNNEAVDIDRAEARPSKRYAAAVEHWIARCHEPQDPISIGVLEGTLTKRRPTQTFQGATPDEQQQAKMLAAKDALFEKLSGRLMQAMAEGGPSAAILVCQKEAPEIAESVGEQQGVSIGRTGVRLRNPNNQAPAWPIELAPIRPALLTHA